MSAPTPAPGDDRPREGYYPDPSIPGYVRYWNGASWVPGTSRPAPSDGTPLAPPDASPDPSADFTAASPAPVASPAASVEATGPHFFDEDPGTARQYGDYGDADGRPAAAWSADRSHQSGFGGEQDRRISWGATADDGGPEAGASGTAPPAPGPAKPGFAAGRAAAERAAAAQAAQAAAQVQAPATAPEQPAVGGYGFPPAAGQPTAPPSPGVPHQLGPAQASAPLAPGPGGGQSSWAQQVHRLADADESPLLWKPPVDDIFQAAARRQASARPAGLGKRLAARLVDTLVLAAVTSAAAVPLGAKALDHVDAKIDEARLSGRTVTVWLLDGTTGGYLAVVLAVLLVFGILYEALPTAKWGRTLGKKLLGLEVRDIEGQQPPSFGAALRRWLVYLVPGLLAIGVVGVVWGLFDRPWRQCWHDKAAHTFVAG